MNATDGDSGSNARIEYTLRSVNGDGNVRDFTIDKHTGRITAGRLFDREETPILRVRVVAVDNGVEVGTINIYLFQ